jgi:L-iditol 2-dehydrogenase
MLAATWHGANDLRVEERPKPEAGPGEVVVEVTACGVCGTDARILAGAHRLYPPGTIRVPGHEIVGRVAAVGSDVALDVPSGLVAVAPNYGCGVCRECVTGNNNRCPNFQALGITVDGGFAGFVRVPAAAVRQGNVIALDPGVDPAVATLFEPLACVVRGQDPLRITATDTVLVIGAGPIGILHVMLARLKGASGIIIADRWAPKLAVAQRLGADETIDVTRNDLDAVLGSLTGGRGADVVIVAAPSPDDAARSVTRAAPGGRIAFFAGLPKDRATVPLDANEVHYRELALTGTTACSTGDCRRAVEIVNAGKLPLAELVTHRIVLERLPESIAARDPARVKLVASP